MYYLIKNYLQNIQKDDINNFALKKSINLTEEELEFTYNFIKKNYDEILKNPTLFNIDLYKDKYNPTTFEQIKKVYIEYLSKYQRFL